MRNVACRPVGDLGAWMGWVHALRLLLMRMIRIKVKPASHSLRQGGTEQRGISADGFVFTLCLDPHRNILAVPFLDNPPVTFFFVLIKVSRIKIQEGAEGYTGCHLGHLGRIDWAWECFRLHEDGGKVVEVEAAVVVVPVGS